MIGRFLSSPLWGILCDRWGRKPVLLIGIVTTSILSLLFGMSRSFLWALSFRFLQGLFSPIIIVSRTIISEICTEKEQASAMSYFTLVGNFGNICGNLIGGFFQDPENSSIFLKEFFIEFPFLLPNMFIVISGTISLIICICFLKETKKEDSLLEANQRRSLKAFITDPLVLQILIMFSWCSFISTGLTELFALWAWANKKDQGLEFTPAEIAIASTSVSVLMIIYIKSLFTRAVEKYGLSNTLKVSLQYYAPVLLLVPVISWARYNYILLWICMIIGCLIFFTLDVMNMTSSAIMINNSVKSTERGLVNGISISLGNLARGCSPPLFGFTFALTANSGWIYPFNFAFSFILLAVFITGAWFFSIKLNKELDRPKDEKTINEKTSEMVSLSLVEEKT